jgi:transaldolase
MNDHDFRIMYQPGVVTSSLHMRKLWSVTEAEKHLFHEVGQQVPSSPDEMVAAFRRKGLNDIFPNLSKSEGKYIREDGKIPRHEHWSGAVLKGENAIDTLLNLAGLAAFTKDQEALDARVCKEAGWE